jgi:hypothetical protein
MNNSEFMEDTLSKIVPDSEWHANSNHNVSLDNIDLQKKALEIIWDKLFEDINIYGDKYGIYSDPWPSATMIMDKKREALHDFIMNKLRHTLWDAAGTNIQYLNGKEYTTHSWDNNCVLTLLLNEKEDEEGIAR